MVVFKGYTFTNKEYPVPCSLVILIINTMLISFAKSTEGKVYHTQFQFTFN